MAKGDNLRGRPRPPGAGKPKGYQSKPRILVQNVVAEVLEGRSHRIGELLDGVIANDPGKGLDYYIKLMEYVAPKLARTEVTGSMAITHEEALKELK